MSATRLAEQQVARPALRFDAARLLVPALVAAIATSLVLAVLYFRHVPMPPDGGWYAYPSYAWASGADPSENLQPFAEMQNAENRVVAQFEWENRSNLTVPLVGLWFKAVPAGAESIALLGALQWLAIAGLVGLAVWIVARDRWLALAGAVVTFADSRMIAETIVDARPDAPVLLFASGLLVALVAGMTRGGRVARLVAVLLAMALPLVHVTSANAIAALSAFIVFWMFLEWRNGARPGGLLVWLLPVVAMAAAFLLRQPLLDWLIPTGVPASIEAAGQHSLVAKLKGIVDAGFLAKATMEIGRWGHQFHVANLGQLGFLLAGAASLFLFRRSLVADRAGRVAVALFGGFLVGVLAMFAGDPHHTSGHALVLAVIGYVAAAIAIARVRGAGIADKAVVAGLVLLLAGTAALKVVHSGLMEWRYAREGISTAAVAKELAAVVAAGPKDRPLRIMGATEIWPYLVDLGTHIEIVDPDRYTLPKDPAALPDASADVLVVNDDHYAAGWAEPVAAWSKAGLIEPIASVGECGRTARCLAIYRIVKR